MKIKKLLTTLLIFLILFFSIYLFLNNFYYIKDPSIFSILSMYFSIILCIYLNVFIHEAGHFILGKLSGYRLIMFRLGPFAFLKTNDSYSLKRYKIKGTMGQCILYPPEESKDNCLMYLLGGTIGNFFICLILFISSFFLYGDIIRTCIFLCLFLSLSLGVLNIIPFTIGGIPNDGFNFFNIFKNKENSVYLKKQLRLFSFLAEDNDFEHIPEEFITNYYDINNRNPLYLIFLIQSASTLLYNGEFTKYKEFFSLLINSHVVIPDLYIKEMKCELLFIEILTSMDNSKIDSLYYELSDHFKSFRSHLSKQRILYSYNLLYLNNKEEALLNLDCFNKICDTHPLRGEIYLERKLLATIKK